MKKVMIGALALVAAFTVQAQNKKGNLMIGTYVGSGSYSSSNYKSTYSYAPATEYKSEYKSFSIGVGPEIGWYITDRLVLGTSLGLSYYHQTSKSSNTTTTNTSSSKSNSFSFSAGPSARLYFGEKNDKGAPFVWLGANISFYPSDNTSYKNDPLTYDYTYKTKNYVSWGFGPRVGYEHFFNQHVGLQYYIGYTYSHYSTTYTYDYTVGGTDFSYKTKYNAGGINFGAGLNFHLEKNKKK